MGRPLRERLRADRPLTSYTRVQAAIGAVLRNRWSARARRAEYLNVGCGTNIAAGFVNLDYHWRPGVALCWDLTRSRLPFADASLHGIFTEHCIEHISVEQCAAVLRDFARVLRPGARARIVVPDAELFMRGYVEGAVELEEVNRIFRDHGHLYAYDHRKLERMLREAGFGSVERASFGVGGDAKLLNDTESRRGESMYLEAVR